MKYGVCSWILPIEEQECFVKAKELGLDGVAISLNLKEGALSLAEQEKQKKLIALAKENNIEILALALNFLCEFSMTEEDNQEILRKYLEEAVTICKNMNIKDMQVPSFFASAIKSENDFNYVANALSYLCKLVEGTNIGIGWENAEDTENNLKMIEKVNSSSLFIYFDTLNPVVMSGLDNIKLAKETAHLVNGLHAKDGFADGVKKPLQLGEGVGNVPEVLDVFKQNGYDGWVVLESHYSMFEGWENIIEKDTAFLKAFFN